jgi:sodium-dependent dicarboxylate transporter 2/3/5
VLVRRFPPEVATLGDVESTRAQRRSARPLGAGEKKVLSLLSVMIVLWIASTWIRALDVVLVAIGGAVALFLPGFRLFTWKEAERAIGWDSILMIGGVTSLGAASVQTDLARWLVEQSLGGLQHWPAVWAVAGISAFTVVIHLVLPIGPVVNTVMIPPIALLALATGQNPALYGLPVAFTASCAFLLPLDAVPLLTYSTGYYRMLDMLTPGAIISVAWVVWITVLVALLGPWLGLA